ncbi:MAG: fumarylacetoacetate hydrolase family protein [Phycisphaerales bacterium]|nr:fumarylacetoacetate hydrolase family protein [Phycisphaerales bacterium]
MGGSHPPAVLCIGRNYAAHAEELSHARPERPMVFFKNPGSVIRDGEAIVIPEICGVPDLGVDYEGELALVIGRDCRDVAEVDAFSMISHYCVANDVCHRWWQWEGSGGQYSRGKSFDTFCPLGEYRPADEVGDPGNLRLRTWLNGEVVQDSSTSQMLFPVPVLIAELSRATTLLEGTVILTGTPAGVGAGQDPPRFLRAGDELVIEVERVGTLRNHVIEP